MTPQSYSGRSFGYSKNVGIFKLLDFLKKEVLLGLEMTQRTKLKFPKSNCASVGHPKTYTKI